jgi:cell division protein FtsL
MVAEFKKNKKSRPSRRLVWIAASVALFFLFAVLVVANIHMYQKRRDFLAQAASLESQISNLKQSNGDLQEKIASAGNSEYTEKVAREELDMQKPGEQVVTFIMPQQPPQNKSGQNPVQGWFNGVWQWMMKSI